MRDWLSDAIALNQQRLQRLSEAKDAGAAWLVECRDMWDSHDRDAGVYWVPCFTPADVDALAVRMPDDSPDERLLGIYRLDEPVENQGPGLTRSEWLDRRIGAGREDATEIRLLVLDVEGVIISPGGSQEPWPLTAMLELRRVLAEAPVACVLCTGRQVPYGEAVIQALSLFRPLSDAARERVREQSGCHLLSWPSVLENGAYFYDPLAKCPIPHPALTRERIRTLQRLKTEVLAPLVAETGAQFEAGKEFCVSINPPLLDPHGEERQTTAAFRPLVDAAIGAYGDEVEVKHSASAVDITPRGVSKASAVRLLLEWTGLHPAEVLGVGDTQADAAWLGEVGWRAAPANGREALPGVHYYSAAAVADGLLDILERLREREWRGL